MRPHAAKPGFLRLWTEEKSLFKRSVLFSIFLHLAFFGALSIRSLLNFDSSSSGVEIDLTKPFSIGNPNLKAGGGNLDHAPKKEGVPLKAETIGPKDTQPKDWVIPGPQTKILEKPVEAQAPSIAKSGEEHGDPTADGIQGKGPGWQGGEGEGGGVVTKAPELLNKKEVLRLLKKNYPAIEREAGQSGTVYVHVHVNEQGLVTGAEVIGSAGSAFDGAALVVSKKMRFSPAMIFTKPVATKIRQRIVFKLDEE